MGDTAFGRGALLVVVVGAGVTFAKPRGYEKLYTSNSNLWRSPSSARDWAFAGALAEPTRPPTWSWTQLRELVNWSLEQQYIFERVDAFHIPGDCVLSLFQCRALFFGWTHSPSHLDGCVVFTSAGAAPTSLAIGRSLCIFVMMSSSG